VGPHGSSQQGGITAFFVVFFWRRASPNSEQVTPSAAGGRRQVRTENSPGRASVPAHFSIATGAVAAPTPAFPVCEGADSGRLGPFRYKGGGAQLLQSDGGGRGTLPTAASSDLYVHFANNYGGIYQVSERVGVHVSRGRLVRRAGRSRRWTSSLGTGRPTPIRGALLDGGTNFPETGPPAAEGSSGRAVGRVMGRRFPKPDKPRPPAFCWFIHGCPMPTNAPLVRQERPSMLAAGRLARRIVMQFAKRRAAVVRL